MLTLKTGLRAYLVDKETSWPNVLSVCKISSNLAGSAHRALTRPGPGRPREAPKVHVLRNLTRRSVPWPRAAIAAEGICVRKILDLADTSGDLEKPGRILLVLLPSFSPVYFLFHNWQPIFFSLS